MKTLVSFAAVLAVALVIGGAGAAPPEKGERAFPGAAPTVPHEVEERKGICQDCHATGTAGAPVTPHPGRVGYCTACHAGQDDTARPFPPAR
jgi:hypothetical protein